MGFGVTKAVGSRPAAPLGSARTGHGARLFWSSANRLPSWLPGVATRQAPYGHGLPPFRFAAWRMAGKFFLATGS